ncbi:MAG: group 1 glycosyl transferase [Phycisphaeraceae bacterium]|nr:group 1 glycosyl transferase [Phycisphaeraceae bacterium]
MINITSFTHLHRTQTPTGVGVHIIEMLRELASRDQVNLQMLISAKETDGHGQIKPEFALGDLPFVTYPFSRRIAEGLWRTVNWPRIDRYVGKTDVLYSPTEAVIASEKVPQVLTIHDMYLMEPDLPWSQSTQSRKAAVKWEKLTRKMVDRASRIVTVSQFTKQRMVELLGADPDQIFVVGNGIGQAYFEPNLKAVLPVSEPYVLVVGGLTQRKNGSAVFAAAQALEQMDSQIKIIVAGHCPTVYANEASHHPNIRLLGYVDDDILPALMARSVALLFLSRYEGFGMPAVEAMAAGTPVIVSPYASLPEIVGDAGLIMDPDDEHAIASQIVSLARTPHSRDQLIAKGKAWAEQYTWEHCVDRLLKTMH